MTAELTPNTPITQANVECGGCGENDPTRRCIGCLHDFRPALAKPAEGEVEAEYRRAVRDTNNMRDDGTIKPPATPTPPSVDWERVGPKLVEALEKARDHYDMMTRLANVGVVYEVNRETGKRTRRKLSEVIATEANAGSKHCRSALAAAQPEGK